jgi:hypothetical protein
MDNDDENEIIPASIDSSLLVFVDSRLSGLQLG